MSPSCRIFILLLAAAAMGKPTTWQQGESPLTGVSTVSEQDLLAQPPGSNWTSYNGEDRKSTRLNSSHSSISYAVFCLKKKKKSKKVTLQARPVASRLRTYY